MKKMKNIFRLFNWNNIIMKMMKLIKHVLIFCLITIIVLLSLKLEIVTLSFDNITEVLTVSKVILWKLGVINSKGIVTTPWILGFKIRPLLVLLLYVGTVCITFIFTNYTLFLYIMLVYIFVKCLLTDFYVKHFKFNKYWNIENISHMWQQRKKIASFLIKLFLLMVPMRFFIRTCALGLFDFHLDIISTSLLVLLTLPFVYSFSNIIRKYLISKKQEDKEETRRRWLSEEYSMHQTVDRKKGSRAPQDSFLFNDYVIKKINLYNITSIIFTLLMIRYYLYYYIIIVTLSLAILIILALYSVNSGAHSERNSSLLQQHPYRQNKLQSSSLNNQIHLEAACGPVVITLGWACFMNDLGTHLTKGACMGHNSPDTILNSSGFSINDQTNEYNQFVLRNVYPNHFNCDVYKQEDVTCYNWLHRSVGSANDAVWFSEVKDIQHAVTIAQSKILRMVYMQRYILEHQQGQFKREELGRLEPQTLFKNDKFIGSVGRIKNTLVINFVKNDGQHASKREFLPSFYVHDDSLRYVNQELEPVIQTIEFLEEKYGIYIPNRDSVLNIISFTETEKLRGGDPSLIKIFRPSTLFTDLHTMYSKPVEYFLCRKIQNWGDLKDGPVHSRIRSLQGYVQYHQKTDEIKFYSEELLNEIYMEYIMTRVAWFRSVLRFEPDLSFNSTPGHWFYSCTCSLPRPRNLILFRQDDLDIFNYKVNTLVDMTWTRRRLLDKLKEDNIYSSFYVVLANRVTMELLSIERPYGEEIPKIYSIIDTRNATAGSGLLIRWKHSFNILDKQDGETLKKLLIYGN